MADVHKINHPLCEWGRFEKSKPCSRQANFQVRWIGDHGMRQTSLQCYRHRNSALERVQREEDSREAYRGDGVT